MPLTLQHLAPDVLTHIAFCLAKSTEPENPYGPPKHLRPLLLTSKTLYNHLNPRTNAHLYAQIFRYQFDVASLHRRLPSSRLTAPHLAAELARRWTSLKRIRDMGERSDWRSRVYPEHLLREDIMTAYLMLLESDGRNAMQVVHFARIHNWIGNYFNLKLSIVHRDPIMPPETEEASLALWVTWLLTDYRSLLNERDTRALNWICTPYMLGTFFYKNSFAPWTSLNLPVDEDSLVAHPPSPSPTNAAPLTQNACPFFIYDTTPTRLPLLSTTPPTPSTSQPRGRGRPRQQQEQPSANGTFTYFGAPLAITVPLISHAATLLFASRQQKLPFYNPNAPGQTPEQLLAVLDHLERERGLVSSGSTTVAQLGLAHTTLEDAEARLKGVRSYAPEYLHIRLPSLGRSESWDEDWARLVGCWNPFEVTVGKELGMPRYAWTKGSLSGEWDGRFMLPDMDSYLSIINGRSNPLNTLEDAFLLQNSQSWHIQEHYHSASAVQGVRGPPVPAGHPIDAFIRQRTHMQNFRGRGLAVCEGNFDVANARGELAFYETWAGGMQGSDVGVSQTTADGLDSDCDMAEDEDEDEDEDEGRLSIIITGESIPQPDYLYSHPSYNRLGSTIRGTVRKWDGLITLRSRSTVPDEWIWRGYLVGDGNFVGRWRDASMDVRRNAHEGAFAMRRRTPAPAPTPAPAARA